MGAYWDREWQANSASCGVWITERILSYSSIASCENIAPFSSTTSDPTSSSDIIHIILMACCYLFFSLIQWQTLANCHIFDMFREHINWKPQENSFFISHILTHLVFFSFSDLTDCSYWHFDLYLPHLPTSRPESRCIKDWSLAATSYIKTWIIRRYSPFRNIVSPRNQ